MKDIERSSDMRIKKDVTDFFFYITTASSAVPEVQRAISATEEATI